MNEYDLCIIGAGASGLTAAIEASKRGLSTIIIEKNKKIGRKLYATGNGRCNIANAVLRADSFFFNSYVNELIDENTSDYLREYFLKLGVPFSEKDGLFYPSSFQASTVVWALRDAAVSTGVSFATNNMVSKIEKGSDGSHVVSFDDDGESIKARNLILAMGSPASKSAGGTDADDIYRLFKAFGISYNEFRPVLTPIPCSDIPEELNGVRAYARAEISYEGQDKERVISETGELQFLTGFLSGIMIFNLSYYVRNDMKINIDLIPDRTYEEIMDYIVAEYSVLNGRTDTAILNGFVNDKLAAFFAESMEYDSNDINERKNALGKVFKEIKNWTVTVRSSDDFSKAQSSAGGIDPELIDLKTMRLNAEPSVAVTGECVDITGKCGGYNLMWAFMSGITAGRNIDL